MERKNYIVAVDLGSSAVVVAVAAKEDDGTLKLKALVSKPVQGVNAGRIDNIESVGQALAAAVAEAGEAAGIRITEAYAGISGDFVRCARHTDYVYIADPQSGVAQSDVASLFDRMRNVQAPDDETIMERIPQHYLVDGEQEPGDPIGRFGRKLSSTFNFILCQRMPLQRLDMALKRVGVTPVNTIPNSLAVAEAVLTADEKEEGVAVVNVGSGVTDVTVYYRNVVHYAASIPMGASAINHDIRTMGVPERHVEDLKRRYGSAVAERAPEDKLIRVTGRTARDARDILLRNLATVIEARAMDIIDFVKEELKISGCADKLAYGLVLTGGSANLRDLDELFRNCTGLEVRVATPEEALVDEREAVPAAQPDAAPKQPQPLADPAFSTVVGLLLKGSERSKTGVAYVPGPAPQPVQPEQQPEQQPAAAPEAPAVPVQPVHPAQPVAHPGTQTAPHTGQPAVHHPAEGEPKRPSGPKRERGYHYVPPVVPSETEKRHVPPVAPVAASETKAAEEQPVEKPGKKEGGFWGWVRKMTEGFEAPGDEEI